MPNEFIARNGIISRGNLIVSGSLVTTQPTTFSGSLSLTGDLNFQPGTTRYISMSASPTTASGDSIIMQAGNATAGGTGGSLYFRIGTGAGGPGSGAIYIGNQGANSIWPTIDISGPTTIYNSGPNTGTSLTVNGGGQLAMRWDWDNINLVTSAVSSASRILRFTGASQYQVRGSGTTSSTTAFQVQNANASSSFSVKDNGYVEISNSTGVNVPFKVFGENSGLSVYTNFDSNINALTLETNNNYGNRITFYNTSYGSTYHIGQAYFSNRLAVYDNTYTELTSWDLANMRVGIGITSPTAKLHISGSSSSTLLKIDSTASSSILVVSGSGRVGIGTSTPSYNLEVSSTGYTGLGIMSGANSLAEINFQNRGYALPRWTIRAGGAADGSSGNLTFQRMGSTFPFTITSGDNILVGVGTDIGARLGVRGSGTTSSTTSLLVQNANASASFTVLDNGYVGIGTSSPAYNLDVSGSLRTTGNAIFQNSLNAAANFNIAGIHQDGRMALYGTDSNGTIQLLAHRGAQSGGVAALFPGSVNVGGGLTGALGIGPGGLILQAHTVGTGGIGLGTHKSLAIATPDSTTGGFGGATGIVDFATYSTINNSYSGSRPSIRHTALAHEFRVDSGTGQTNPGTTVMIISGSGYVGIGTSSPAYKLDVNGSTNITGSLTVTGSITATGGLTASSAIINGNLTVIGTASFTYTTASVVNIGGNLINLNTDNPAARFGGLTVTDSGSFGTSSTGSLLWDSQNNRWIYSNPSGSSYDGGLLISGPRNTSGLGSEEGTTLNALMKGQGGDHITSSGVFEVSGSVGIGTGTPSYTLDVYGSPRFYGDGNHMYTRIFSGATNKDSKILFGNDAERFNVGLAASSNTFAINSSNGGTLTSLNIDYTTGNVGIGTTTPSAQLQVKGSGTTSSTTALLVQNSNASASLAVLDNGNIGIGTASPTAQLHFNGQGSGTYLIKAPGINGNSQFQIYRPQDNTTSVIWYSTGNDHQGSINNDTSARMRISGSWFIDNDGVSLLEAYSGYTKPALDLYTYTYQYDFNTPLLRARTNTGNTVGDTIFQVNQNGNIYTSGSIGIGTTSPAYKLDVSGSVRVMGTNKLNFGGTGSADAVSWLNYDGTDNLQITHNVTNRDIDFNVNYGGTLVQPVSIISYNSPGLPGLYLKSVSALSNNSAVLEIANGGTVQGISGTGMTFTAGNTTIFRGYQGGSEYGYNFKLIGYNAGAFGGGYFTYSSRLPKESGVDTERFRLHTNGNFGFYNSNPQAIIDVNGNVKIKGTGTTNSTTALLVQNANASASLVVLDNGNIGIGTTAPDVPLHVSSSSTILGRFQNNATAAVVQVSAIYENTFRAGTSSDNSEFWYDGGYATTYIDNNYPNAGASFNQYGDIRFRRKLDGTNLSTVMTIRGNNGDIGIGTTSPAYKLDVSGSGNFTNNLTVTGSIASLVNNTYNLNLYNSGSTDPQFQWKIGKGWPGQYDTSLLFVYGTGSVNSLITPDGHFYGTSFKAFTSSPGSSVAVTSNSHNNSYLGFEQPSSGIPGNNIVVAGWDGVKIKATTGNISFQDGSSNTLMFVSQSGNVGIGTTSALGKLHVKGSGTTDSTTSLLVQNSSGQSYLQVVDNGVTSIGKIGDGELKIFSGNYRTYAVALSNKLEFQDAYGVAGALNSTGLVLTSTSDPVPKNRLDVAGRVFIGSTIAAASASLHISSSLTGSTPAVLIQKSGSTVLDIQGSQGQLFSVVDTLSGSLMSVNDVSGLPILEVFSDDRVVLGTYGSPALTITGSNAIFTGSVIIDGAFLDTVRTGSLPTGSSLVYTVNTGSYTAGFFDYYVSSGSNFRAGNIMAVFGAGTYKFTDLATPDIGSTTNLQFSMSMAGASAQLYASASSAGWTVKTTFRTI
jgi:hypothetical protein